MLLFRFSSFLLEWKIEILLLFEESKKNCLLVQYLTLRQQEIKREKFFKIIWKNIFQGIGESLWALPVKLDSWTQVFNDFWKFLNEKSSTFVLNNETIYGWFLEISNLRKRSNDEKNIQTLEIICFKHSKRNQMKKTQSEVFQSKVRFCENSDIYLVNP
jgi:hypothetical protein